jgi:hypothetical protein
MEQYKNDLLRSLFFTHTQPPVLNLFIGTVYKLFPGSSTMVFQICFIAMGLITALALYALMRRLGVCRAIAAVVTSIFILSPAFILYENLLFYEMPAIMLLTVSALLLCQWIDNRHIGYLIGILITTVLLVWTRSVFHLVWLVAAYGIVVLYSRRAWKPLLIALMVAAIPFAKNYIVFGEFTISTLLNTNIPKTTTRMLSEETRIDLVSRDILTPLGNVYPPPTPWDYYKADLIETGIPILDLEQVDGAVNYNNSVYLQMGRQYRKDAEYVFLHYPGAWIRGMKQALSIYFLPTYDWFKYRPPNRKHIGAMSATVPIKTVFIGVIVLSLSSMILFRHNKSYLAIMGYMLMTVLYVTLLTSAIEIGENQRFRFLTNPFMYTLAAVLISDIGRKIRHA